MRPPAGSPRAGVTPFLPKNFLDDLAPAPAFVSVCRESCESIKADQATFGDKILEFFLKEKVLGPVLYTRTCLRTENLNTHTQNFSSRFCPPWLQRAVARILMRWRTLRDGAP